MGLKSKILENPFVEKLRMEMVIDQDSFNELCDCLRSLAEEWNNEALVDKELVQELYTLTIIIRGAADAFRRHQDISRADQVMEMMITIEALVLESLA